VTERRYSSSEHAQDEVETDHLETERKNQNIPPPEDESNCAFEPKKANSSNLVKLTPNK